MNSRRHERAMFGALLVALLVDQTLVNAANIRIWAFEATVIDLDDPQGLFDDVRLGDRVLGTFSYDLDRNPSSSLATWFHDHPDGFQGVQAVIENLRTGHDLVYLPQGYYSIAAWTDETSFFETSWLNFWQDVVPPLPGVSDSIFLDFFGDNLLPDARLPEEIVLEAWEEAFLTFGADQLVNGVTAQLYLVEPLGPGDYDRSGSVDAADLGLWQQQYGAAGLLAADGNRDGKVGGRDFLIWQGRTGSVNNATMRPVPEPTSFPLALATLGSLFWRRLKTRH